MEKTEFLEIAHLYYALAIWAHIRKARAAGVTHDAIYEDWSYGNQFGERLYYISHEEIFDRAEAWLVAKGLAKIIRDPLGPSLIRKSEAGDKLFAELAADENHAFYIYDNADNPRGWLRTALENLDTAYQEFGIVPEDFDKADSEWTPLPLERSGPEYTTLIETLNELIEGVRSNNGYRFRSEIAKVLTNFKLKWGDSEFEHKEEVEAAAQNAQEEAKPEQPSSLSAVPNATAAEIIKRMPQLTPLEMREVATLEQNFAKVTISDADKVSILEHALAKLSIEKGHEVVYRTIWGSQIQALQRTALGSQGGVATSDLRDVYATAAAAYPDFYKSLDFDRWLVFLTRMTLVQPNDIGKLVLTAHGQEFLAYLQANSITTSKPF